MSESQDPDDTIPTSLEEVIERFEDAWQSGKRPRIEDHLTGGVADRRALLVELVHIDLERRLKAGDAARIVQYLRRFPELANDHHHLLSLLATEYHLRRQREPDLTPEAVADHLPEYAADLRAELGLPAAPPPGCIGLLERLRQREALAWQRFVRLFTPLLYSWVRRLGVPEAEAPDLVESVCRELQRQLPGFRGGPRHSFRRWLRTLLLARWSEHRRRGSGVSPPVAEGELFSEAEYHRLLVPRGLRLLQAEFEPQTWRAFWEQVVRRRPATEVAKELGLEVVAVLVARSEVVARLRQELAGLLN